MSVRIGRAALVAALLATGSAAGSGCATSGDVDRLEARIGGLEKFRDRLEQSMKEDVARLEKLHQMLTEAEETLRKSGANLGLRVERLETDDTKLKGDLEAARNMHYKLSPLAGALFLETNPIPVKTASGMIGLAAGPLRLPLAPMSETNEKKLKEAVDLLGEFV
ncbi:MAG TPA: dihydrodipicolinate synthase family protein [Methanothrix sp.]|nr:dihydrodipicolinate synthase family protein [Methanothrix sp.]